MKRALFFILLSAVITFEAGFCWADLKPDELFSIMRASRGRYVSVEATMVIKGFYESQERQDKPVLMYSQENVYRRLNDLVYAECVTKSFTETGDLDSHSKEVAVVTPSREQYYSEEPIGNIHAYGHIRKNDDNELWGRMSLTPDIIFWWNLARPGLETKYSRFLREHADNATIVYDETIQAYILHNRVGIEENAPGYRYTIDPSKGYMPVIQEWLDWDKTLIEKNVCADYRQVNGLWAPFRYSVYLPSGNLATDVTIKSLSINQPIAPQKLTFQFPAGTHVIDKILGVTYTVGAKDAAKKPLAADESNTPASGLAPPATDAELAQSALKAQELLAEAKQAATATPSVPPVEISPSYVWVLNGKNDYTLAVTSPADATTTLVSHSFEDGGLILHALNNQLSTTGQITATVERPPDLEAYADGVLTLTFADQTATVHFIAAPVMP
jgi:hypothetical protein